MKINYLKKEKCQLPNYTCIMRVPQKWKIFNIQYPINMCKKSVLYTLKELLNYYTNH